MKRILVASDSRWINTDLIKFSSYIARQADAPLFGVLLNNANIELGTAANYRPSYYDENKTEYGPVMMDTQHATMYFLSECNRENIQASVLVLNGSPTEELVYESRFADLIILEPELSFLGDADEVPSSYVRQILNRSECPVLLAPAQSKPVEQLIFCFDGSALSLFAIRQFTYLFPEYAQLPVVLLEICESALEANKKDYNRMRSWLHQHYLHFDHHFVEGDVRTELFAYLVRKENLMVVMGAYRKNLFSNLFNKISSPYHIPSLNLPLFITHN